MAKYSEIAGHIHQAESVSIVTGAGASKAAGIPMAGINWGQIALALMLQNKHVARVLTFNFDLVLERAAALIGLHLPVYDFGAAPAGATDILRVSNQAIIHLHGQSNGLVLLNTAEEIAVQAKGRKP